MCVPKLPHIGMIIAVSVEHGKVFSGDIGYSTYFSGIHFC